MSCTNRKSTLYHQVIGLVLGICMLPLAVMAQEPALGERVDAATSALTELDAKAEACLTGLDTATTLEARQLCDEFLQAIDGELLAGYLSHCEALKDWRDAFVASAISTPAGDQNDTERLELMVGIEFACGEGALQKRTGFVINTFTLLQDGQIQNQRTDAALARRLAELEFEATLSNERRLLQNSILRQRSRIELQTQRQWDDLENELIRQQIRNPSRN